MRLNRHQSRFSFSSGIGWLSVFALFPFALFSCQEEKNTEPVTSTIVPQVRVIEFGKDQAETVLEFSGTLQENCLVPIAFQVSGRVISLAVDNGDTLKSGAFIAALDSASLLDAYLANKAKLVQAQDAYDRLKPMHDSGAIPQVKFVEVETGLAQAQALTSLARKNLDDARLLAPVGGIVVQKSLEVGQSVMPGVPVLSLVDPRYIDAVFPVPETDILRVRHGRSMRVTLPGGGEPLNGLISEVAIQADPVSRSYPIHVRLDNRKGLLR
ncbi:MAG TPA: efflux RND transporter periplasmic adaptor subunit, partial [Fibrobacteraceae bacterium]|nr:efflux RND transporter periplasmic adaptor subunit [Fibrobacteraceae bacterium]